MTLLEPAAGGRKKPARRRRKWQQGKPNKLAPELAALLASPEIEFGPAMKALPSDRHRAFCLALYQVKPGYGANVKAAKLAGFGTSTTSAKSWSALASLYANDERVQAALFEEDQKRLRASAPRAIRALQGLVEDPTHKDHARGIGMVLDRVHPVETTHHIDVDHHHRHRIEANEKTLARIHELTLLAGMDPAKLPPMIDGTFTKILAAPVVAQPREDDHEQHDD